MLEKDKTKIEIVDKCWFVSNGKEKYQVQYVLLFMDTHKATLKTWKIMTQTKTNHMSWTGTWKIYMDEKCFKYCLWMVWSSGWRRLDLMKSSSKIKMNIVTHNTLLSSMVCFPSIYINYTMMLTIPKSCLCYSVIYCSYLKKWKWKM